MSGRAKSEFLVGAVFLAALGILAYYTVLVGRNMISSKKTFPLTFRIEDAAGIQKENKVMVKGVYSGIVTSVELVEEYVEVKLALFNEFQMYPDYRIYISPDNMLGGKQVKIYPGTSTDGDGNASEPLDINGIFRGQAKDPFESLTGLIEDNRENIKITVRNLRGFSEKLNSPNGTVAKLLTNDKIANQTEDLLHQLKDTIEDVREQAPVTSFIRAALTAF